jgi:hypothetical protein
MTRSCWIVLLASEECVISEAALLDEPESAVECQRCLVDKK